MVCRSHTAAERSEPTRPDPDEFRCTQNHSPAAARRIATPSDHTGHVPSSTSVPRENTAEGYLKKNSNIRFFHRQKPPVIGLYHTPYNSLRFCKPKLQTARDKRDYPNVPRRRRDPY